MRAFTIKTYANSCLSRKKKIMLEMSEQWHESTLMIRIDSLMTGTQDTLMTLTNITHRMSILHSEHLVINVILSSLTGKLQISSNPPPFTYFTWVAIVQQKIDFQHDLTFKKQQHRILSTLGPNLFVLIFVQRSKFSRILDFFPTCLS